MIKIIESPAELKPHNPVKLFLAGGITNVDDWQSYIIDRLLDDSESKIHDYLTNLIVLNPRRRLFSSDDVVKQIEWEYDKLKKSDIICFWFAEGTSNPIVLFEYGNFGFNNVPVVVGVDKKYERKFDVEIQTSLRCSDRLMSYDLDEFYYNILKELKKLDRK